jgi:hypothetical protein
MIDKDLVFSARFIDQLIKRSTEAEDVKEACGNIRLTRTALAVLEVYEEMSTVRSTVEREEEPNGTDS